MPDQLVPVRERVSFAKLDEVLPLPDLVGIQRGSFDSLLNEGLKEVLEEVSPIEDFTEQFQLYFGKHQFKEVKATEEECRDRDITYSQPLFVEATFVNKVTGEIKEQEVFMGDFPIMTERGTFIINGTERVVVSQLVRSPGVYFSREMDKTSDKEIFIAKIIPSRGAWLEFDVDKKDTVGVRIDRKRRQLVTVLLKALGWGTDEILTLFDNAPSIQNTLEKDHVETQEEALEDIYRKLRPGEPPTAESAKTLLENLFFNPKRYDVAKVGRHKVDKKLGKAEGVLLKQLRAHHKALGELDNPDKKAWEQFRYRVFSDQLKDEQGAGAPKYKAVLSYEDMLKTVGYLVKLHAGEEGYDPDDIDHFGNRRLRSVGELIQNQIRIGLSRMERVVKERMTTQDVEAITPQTLINIRPVVASIKEFFGTSQLSQFMDQTNTLAGLTHKRRLSALGPGGPLPRARRVRGPRRAPVALRPHVPDRDARGSEHRSDRVALELRAHQRVRVHRDPLPPGREQQDHLEDRLPLGRRGGPSRHRAGQHGLRPEDGQDPGRLRARAPQGRRGRLRARGRGRLHGRLAEAARLGGGGADPVPRARRREPGAHGRQHAEAGRALAPLRGPARGHRGGVPRGGRRRRRGRGRGSPAWSTTSRPTRSWSRSAAARCAPTSCRSSSGRTRARTSTRSRSSPPATGWSRARSSPTGPRPRPARSRSARTWWSPTCRGRATTTRTRSSCRERLVKDDVLTSIHIEEHEVDARDTKLGAEEITRDIPNVSEEILKDLDERGIVRIGAEVTTGDYLVGKVTPEGRDRADPRGAPAPRDLRREGARGARHLAQGAARRVGQGHRRAGVQPRRRR